MLAKVTRWHCEVTAALASLQGCLWDAESIIPTFTTRGQARETNGSVPSKTGKEPHSPEAEKEQPLSDFEPYRFLKRLLDSSLHILKTLNLNHNFGSFP